jgi:hypothetical protein
MRLITFKSKQGNNLKQEAQSRAETVETRVFLGRMAWNPFCVIGLMVCLPLYRAFLSAKSHDTLQTKE